MTIESVVVIGSGTMGAGIAQVAAQSGLNVRLVDVSEAQLERAKSGIDKSLLKLVEKGKLTDSGRTETLSRLVLSADLDAQLKDAHLVIEAVPEKMDLKLNLVRKVTEQLSPDALFGTNTSSLSVTEIAGAAKDPQKVVGLHFFNPVPLMELVEVVRGLATSDESVSKAVAFAKSLQKTPIVVKDAPGFASSRLGVVIAAEAIRMLEQGVASAEDIDRAMELGYRHPMGPLKLTDLVGLDVRLAILEHLHKEVGEQFRPPVLLRQMVRAGRLGKKSGEGFYKY